MRPLVLKEQRKRANLITTLRRIAAKHPGVDLSGDLDITPTSTLEDMLEQVKGMAGDNVRVIMGATGKTLNPATVRPRGSNWRPGPTWKLVTRSAAQRQTGRVRGPRRSSKAAGRTSGTDQENQSNDSVPGLWAVPPPAGGRSHPPGG